MRQLTDREKDAVRYVLLFLFVLVSLMLCRRELQRLFAPDPPIEKCYEYSFYNESLAHAENIIQHYGFVQGQHGLQLPPSSTGGIVFAFDKEAHQGCLLRVWFYGDRGSERPNCIKISADGGVTFQELSKSRNHVGTVFDLSDRLTGCTHFQLAFEAKNQAFFPATVMDGIEVVIGSQAQIKPSLPAAPKLLGLIFIASLLFVVMFSKKHDGRDTYARLLIVIIVLIAAYLRWNEVLRISGCILDEDARGYYAYAQKISLFGEHGFYSAQFEKREPLFILVVHLFFTIFGAAATHLRFVSFVFSLLVIYLTYRIGREWFHSSVGLIAAFILSVHPFLIQLSARGLREEWFSVLLLLFVYYGYVKSPLVSWLRVAVSGPLAGCILLTRSECLPMIVILLLLYPFLAGRRWNYAMAIIALLLGVSLWLPHQYSMYREHGDFFYTANQYARFYTNREFAGKAGFPTREEVRVKGMYCGPKTTPLSFYCGLHSPWQLASGSLLGFAKIHLKMPLSFISGRGNAVAVLYSITSIKEEPRLSEMLSFMGLAGKLLIDTWWANLMGCSVLLAFLLGLILLGIFRCWLMYVCLILFQLHTSFLAYLGLDERLCVQSYPLIALCCGFSLYVLYRYRTGKSRLSQGSCSCGVNTVS